MKIVRVVAAVIKSINEKGQTIIFATQRGYGDIKQGKPILKEHEAAKWLTKGQLYDVDWLPADVTLIDKIKKNIWDIKA